MNHQPQDSRRRAERKFVNALDELEMVLKSAPPDSSAAAAAAPHPPTSAAPPHRDQPRQSPQVTEAANDFGKLLDDAVQDIEQFMAAEAPTQDEP